MKKSSLKSFMISKSKKSRKKKRKSTDLTSTEVSMMKKEREMNTILKDMILMLMTKTGEPNLLVR